MEDLKLKDLLQFVPFDAMAQYAKELQVDKKAKKLNAVTLFVLLLQSYITTDRLSQRVVCLQGEHLSLTKIYGVDIYCGSISHSSLSDRLANIKPAFFELLYQNLYDEALRECGYYALAMSNIIRIDTSYVAETSTKLLEGIQTGVNERYGGERKQIKYGFAFDGFSTLVAEIFDKQRESSEEVALAATIKDAISKDKDGYKVYTFDRGVNSNSNLKEISRLTEEKHSCFVARLKANRLYKVLEERPVQDQCDTEYNIVGDYDVYLRKSSSTNWDTSVKYRIIRVTFTRPRPKSKPRKSKRRQYDEVMTLITNDFESSALTIATEYRQRWSIEVFFRFLKQNLSFAHLMSVNKNGIQVMLYMTMIVALLVKIFQEMTGLGPKMALLELQIQMANWLYLYGDKDTMKICLKESS